MFIHANELKKYFLGNLLVGHCPLCPIARATTAHTNSAKQYILVKFMFLELFEHVFFYLRIDLLS